MPTQTYFNLSSEKKTIIMNAALKEFSINSIDNALVSNIVEEANISRGSFYKYFENIDDLYLYFFMEIKKKAHQIVIDSLNEADGELFYGLELAISKLANNFFANEYRSYFKVMMLNANYKTTSLLLNDSSQKKDFTTFKDIMNTEQLKIKPEDFMSFFRTLMSIISNLINDYFIEEWTTKKLNEEYKLRVSWIKYGILK